jgi:hypothetical protein
MHRKAYSLARAPSIIICPSVDPSSYIFDIGTFSHLAQHLFTSLFKPFVFTVSMAETDRSDSLEKGNAQEMQVAEKSLGSGEFGLTPAGVPHKDDPRVCFITTVL